MPVPPLPPPHQPLIEAVEVRHCERSDVRCWWETANDLLEGLAHFADSSAISGPPYQFITTRTIPSGATLYRPTVTLTSPSS